MKKIFYLLVLLLCMPKGMFAYEQIGQLNPYAYAVEAESRNGILSVTYKLNSPADSTIIAIYCNGVEIDTQAVEDNSLGSHCAIVDLTQFAQEGNYTVGIRVYKQSYDAPFQLREILDGSTDTTALHYAFFHPKGVDIDVDPYSPNFGRLLTDEGMMEVPDPAPSMPTYHSSIDKNGIYAFDASFVPIPNGDNLAFRGEYDYTARMSNTLNGGKYAYAYTPYRIRISKDGRIFVSMHDDKSSTLYELSQDLQTWTPIFSGTMTNGVILDENGAYVTGINCGLDVRGEGENLEIIMLNCNSNAYSSYSGNDFVVATYKLGTATSWTGPATTVDTLSRLIGTQVVPVASSAGIACDGSGGFWYHSARPNMINEKGLCHVNAAGEVDFEFQATAADTAKYHIVPDGSYGGAGCRIIKNGEDDYLYVGMGRTISGCGHMLTYKIIYDVNGGVSDLEVVYDEHFIGISRALNDFALDYAHNLFVVGNSNEMIIPIALPYSGMVETPSNITTQSGDDSSDDVESPFVAWCADNTTLYFDYGIVPDEGDTYNSQTITNVWSGTDVIASGPISPAWNSVANSTCTNVVFMPSFANVSPTSCIWWFHDFQNLTTIDNLNYLNTANVTDMYGMFQGCSALTSLDVSNFNTANVMRMDYMFSGCSTLASLDMSGFSTENVMYMNDMFSNCSSLTTLDLSNFNTSNVMDMTSMFNWCLSLSSLDVSNFNTANVIYMGAMFAACTSIASLDLRGFNTANVTDMGSMFYGCNTLTSILVSDKWTTAHVATSSSMFSGCSSLVGGNGTIYDVSHTDATYARIDEPENRGYLTYANREAFVVWCSDNTTLYFDYNKVPEVGDTYNGQTVTNVWSGTAVAATGYSTPAWNSVASSTCTNVVFEPRFANVSPSSCREWFNNFQNLTTIEGLNYLNTTDVTNMIWMFQSCSSLTSLDVSGFNTANVTSMSWMFSGCSALTALDISNFNTANVTDMGAMFQSCSSLTSLDVSNFNTTNVTSMGSMFSGCIALTALDLSNFNTANVTSMSYMFFGCKALTSLDLSHFNTENVTNMNDMFCNCNALTSLDVSNFNTVNVTYMASMFSNCSATSLDLSSFTTDNVTNMSWMFSGCSSLTSLDLSNFNTENVTNMSVMFQSCSSLTSLDVSNFNTENVTNMSWMFCGCSALKSLLVSDDWTTTNVTSSENMFSGCTNLVGGNGTTYDASHKDATYAHVDEAGSPGYLTRKINSIILTDAEEYSLNQDSTLDAATYQKTLGDERVNKYQSWLVPFDYTLTDEDLNKFDFYRIHMIADSPEPGEGDDTGELWVYLKRLSAGFTLQANMPYVYKPKETVTDYEFTTLNATLKAPQSGILASTQTMDDIFSFYATYDFTSPSALDPFYYVNIDGGLSLGNESSVVVGPYRWILRVTSKNGAAPALARSMRFVGEEDEVTNIHYIPAVEDGIWYSVDGRRLGTTKPAARGIYVQNGKKVVIY